MREKIELISGRILIPPEHIILAARAAALIGCCDTEIRIAHESGMPDHEGWRVHVYHETGCPVARHLERSGDE
jgi:hypothetical protein